MIGNYVYIVSEADDHGLQVSNVFLPPVYAVEVMFSSCLCGCLCVYVCLCVCVYVCVCVCLWCQGHRVKVKVI